MHLHSSRALRFLSASCLALGLAAVGTSAHAIVEVFTDDFSDGAATSAGWVTNANWSVTGDGTFRVLTTSTAPSGVLANRQSPCTFSGSTFYRNSVLHMGFDMKVVNFPLTGSSQVGGFILLDATRSPAPNIYFGYRRDSVSRKLVIRLNETGAPDPFIDEVTLPVDFDVSQFHHFDMTLAGGIVTLVLDSTYTISGLPPAPTTSPGGPITFGLAGLFAADAIGIQAEYDNFELTGDVICTDLDAIVDIDPDTLNTKSNGQWVTAYITLPEGADVADIDTSTISITGLIGVTCDAGYTQALDLTFVPQIGDRDEDGIPDLTVKFNRQQLIPNLCLDDVGISVEGDLTSGDHFSGVDVIRIIARGKP